MTESYDQIAEDALGIIEGLTCEGCDLDGEGCEYREQMMGCAQFDGYRLIKERIEGMHETL